MFNGLQRFSRARSTDDNPNPAKNSKNLPVVVPLKINSINNNPVSMSARPMQDLDASSIYSASTAVDGGVLAFASQQSFGSGSEFFTSPFSSLSRDFRSDSPASMATTLRPDSATPPLDRNWARSPSPPPPIASGRQYSSGAYIPPHLLHQYSQQQLNPLQHPQNPSLLASRRLSIISNFSDHSHASSSAESDYPHSIAMSAMDPNSDARSTVSSVFVGFGGTPSILSSSASIRSVEHRPSGFFGMGRTSLSSERPTFPGISHTLERSPSLLSRLSRSAQSKSAQRREMSQQRSIHNVVVHHNPEALGGVLNKSKWFMITDEDMDIERMMDPSAADEEQAGRHHDLFSPTMLSPVRTLMSPVTDSTAFDSETEQNSGGFSSTSMDVALSVHLSSKSRYIPKRPLPPGRFEAHEIGHRYVVDVSTFDAGEIQRQEVIYEVLVTEREYVRDLKIITELFLRRIREKGLLNHKGIAIVFSNVEQLVPVNMELLNYLEQRRREGFGSIREVGDVFLAVAPFFKIYNTYCGNQPEAVSFLRTQKSNPELQLFLQYCQLRPECRGLDIGAFLLKPIQRICKYPLLLKQILKHTNKDHKDFTKLTEAYNLLTRVVDIVNDQRRQVENRQKMISVLAKLEFQDRVRLSSDPTRRFVHEGMVTKFSTGGIFRTQHRWGVLLTDCFILAKPSASVMNMFKGQGKGARAQVSKMFAIGRLEVEDIPDSEKHANVFGLSVTNTHPNVPAPIKKSYFFSVSTPKDKQVWVTLLRECVLEHASIAAEARRAGRRSPSSNGQSVPLQSTKPQPEQVEKSTVVEVTEPEAEAVAEDSAETETIRAQRCAETVSLVAETVEPAADENEGNAKESCESSVTETAQVSVEKPAGSADDVETVAANVDDVSNEFAVASVNGGVSKDELTLEVESTEKSSEVVVSSVPVHQDSAVTVDFVEPTQGAVRSEEVVVLTVSKSAQNSPAPITKIVVIEEAAPETAETIVIFTEHSSKVDE
ncbi:hypothetical protein BJ742DRAFT_431196 [Cladochytrium replicatum]|nr:hypothetical protein BJ742DRAFT_431196 [Cladochytrium replicatum]